MRKKLAVASFAAFLAAASLTACGGSKRCADNRSPDRGAETAKPAQED
ncbi:MAG: hypothetical protein ACLUD2_13705 [Clostridium sp.]